MDGRKLVATAASAIALTLPAGADAFVSGEWGGNLRGDQDSFISFDTERSATGKKRVVHVFFGGIDMTCPKGTDGETSGVSLIGGFRVRHGEFGRKADAVISGFDPPAKLTGEFKPGKRAVGTIRLRGELDPQGQPGVNCRTGLQEWKAGKLPPT
jgi:hypothetical protein